MNEVTPSKATTVYYIFQESAGLIGHSPYYASQDEAMEAAQANCKNNSQGAWVVVKAIRVTK